MVGLDGTEVVVRAGGFALVVCLEKNDVAVDVGGLALVVESAVLLGWPAVLVVLFPGILAALVGLRGLAVMICPERLEVVLGLVLLPATVDVGECAVVEVSVEGLEVVVDLGGVLALVVVVGGLGVVVDPIGIVGIFSVKGVIMAVR